MASISITKTVKRTALATACALGIGGAVFSTQPLAAQPVAPALPSLRPGQSVEMIAPAATITSTVHYQADIVLTCNTDSCSGNFAKPGANRQINVTRISCFLFSQSSGATYFVGNLDVDNANGPIGPRQFLPIDFSNAHGIFIIDRAADLLIVGRQQLHVGLSMLTGTPTQAECTATGTLSTLG